MSHWTSKAGILLASGVAAGLVFVLPICPSSWANPPVVKVMAQDIRHQSESDFAKGKKQNLKMESEDNQAVLTVDQSGQTATYTSPVIKTKFRFNAVALHWKNRSTNKIQSQKYIKMELRVSKDNLNWTSWQDASASDDGANPKSTETFSDLIFTNRSQYVQYRVELSGTKKIVPRLKDIKITTINSLDGQRVETHKSLVEILFDKIEAAPNKPDVVSRAEWGADESLRYTNGVETWPREYHPVTHLFVHHTDTATDSTTDPAAVVRGIYYYHAVTKGWGDIAYNAIIGTDGKIYEGRKGQDNDVLTPDIVGAGTYAFNKGGFSVSLMGDYQNNPLPANMRAALVKLLTYESELHQIDPTGSSDFVRDYTITDPTVPTVDYNVPNIAGHRDSKYTPGTLCPGQYVYNDLPNIRADVAAAVQADNQSVNPNLKRMDGLNRYEVSANISHEIDNLNIASDTVVIARGDLYTDALSGGPLAAESKSPILLTSTTSLPAAIQTEIQRRHPAKVVILGGTGSVSTNVETQLKNLGVTTIDRIDGPNRFAVSASVAEKVVAGSNTDTAIIASGLNFPDALSASSIAAQKGMPILLVSSTSVPAPIQDFITNHPEIKKYIIVGGPATVSDQVKSAIEATGATVDRISGANRYEVGVNIANYFQITPSSITFARGDVFADALSGGPLAAYTNSPIMLTPSTKLAPEVETYLQNHTTDFQKGYIFGGTSSVTVDVAHQISGYMVPPTQP